MESASRPSIPSLKIRNQAHLIALIGNDGAGKTTQAVRLVEWLRTLGQPAILHPNESLKPLKTALEALALESGCRDAEELLGLETPQLMYVALKWNTMAKLREALRVAGRFVVLDRYSYCHVASVRSQALRCAQLVERVFSIFPRPDLVLHLEVGPETALRRMADRGIETEPMTRAYLRGHLRAYRQLEDAACFVQVDGEGTPDQVSQRIRRETLARFPFLEARPVETLGA